MLTKKLPHMQDLPSTFRMTIFEKGSLLGAEDLLNKTCRKATLTCSSIKGSLYSLPCEVFLMLSKIEPAWDAVLNQCAFKKFRKFGDDIEPLTEYELT